MEQKEIKHNQIETCKICTKEINTLNDKYAIILDCEGESIHSIGFYHLKCLSEKVKGNTKDKTEKQIKDIKEWGESLIEKILGKNISENPKEEYVVN